METSGLPARRSAARHGRQCRQQSHGDVGVMLIPGVTEADLMEMARSVVSNYCRNKSTTRDLYQEMISDALAAAAVALPRFDPARGMRASNYLYRRMQGSLLDGWRTRGHYTRAQIKQNVMADPNLLLPQQRPPLSADIPEVAVMTAMIPSAGDDYQHLEDQDQVRWLLLACTEREQEVLRRHFLLSESLAVLAASMGVTESRVCQIKAQALSKARTRLLDVV